VRARARAPELAGIILPAERYNYFEFRMLPRKAGPISVMWKAIDRIAAPVDCDLKRREAGTRAYVSQLLKILDEDGTSCLFLSQFSCNPFTTCATRRGKRREGEGRSSS